MNRPEIRELESFLAVAEHLNFSKAAKSLHLSQPPLTRHIQTLEEKLGGKLFERNTHAVALTDAGRLFLEDARGILNHLDRAAESVRRARRGEMERLRLAFIGALLDERLVALIQRFRAGRPGCQVQVSDLPPAAQLEALRTGELDGGFIGATPAPLPKGIACTVWSREPLVLAAPEGHALAGERALRWADLKGLPWVMVSRAAAPAFRAQFAELAERHGLAPRIVQESDRVPAILTMVAAGAGVTLVAESARHLLSRGICFRRLPRPEPFLHHTFAYPEAAEPAPLRELLALLKGGGATA